MKQLYYRLTLVLLLASATSFAQALLIKGRSQLNVGMGISNWGVPIYIGIDKAATRAITLGFELSFRSYNERHLSNYYRHNIIGYSGNGNYHFNRFFKNPNKFDLYSGINFGFFSWSSPLNYYRENNSGIVMGFQVGGRFFLSSNIGINLEVGAGNATYLGKLGVTIKM